MLFLVLCVSCVISGSLGCVIKECEDPTLEKEFAAVSFLPNKEELKLLCPKTKAYLECEREYLECTEGNLESMISSSNKNSVIKAKALLSAISVVRDVCDEGSPIHADYVASVGCYREYFTGKARDCQPTAEETPVDTFIEKIYPDVHEEGMDGKIYYEARCVTIAFELSCVLDNLGETCGTVAQRLAVSGFKRMNIVIGASFCSEVENAADILSQFLDHLELDEEKRIITQEIFDILLRRR